MTLLEQTSLESPLVSSAPSELDSVIVQTMREVPYAVGVAVVEIPSGLRTILVHRASTDDVELVEDAAMARILEIRARYSRYVDLVTLSSAEASGIELPTEARAYSLP